MAIQNRAHWNLGNADGEVSLFWKQNLTSGADMYSIAYVGKQWTKEEIFEKHLLEYVIIRF